jgi:hypothetical protein
LFVLDVKLCLLWQAAARACCVGPSPTTCHECKKVNNQWVWADECVGCESCSDGTCVDDDTECTGCESCNSAQCEDNDYECDVCEECQDGNCVTDFMVECSKDSDCPGECHTCDTETPTCACENDDGKCDVCQSCEDGECKCYEIASLDSDTGGICVGCDVTFTVTTDPADKCDCVEWSGGGTPASQDGGCTFITYWGTGGQKTVTASIKGDCTSSKDKGVVIGCPIFFREVAREDLGNGVIHFEYAWESSSATLADLYGCLVVEKVEYQGGNPYVPPDPPFDNWSLENPEINNFLASDGSFWDIHLHYGFSKPYSEKDFTATQIYRYSDGKGNWTTLAGPLSIDRSVYEDAPDWKYKVEKTGLSSELTLP